MSRTKHLLHRARKHFCSDVLSAEQNRSLQHKWVRSVSMLGEKWLLNKPLERQAK